MSKNLIVDGISSVVEGVNNTIGEIGKDTVELLIFSEKIVEIISMNIINSFTGLIFPKDSIREAINVALATNTRLDTQIKDVVIDFVISLMTPEKLIYFVKKILLTIQNDIKILAQIQNIQWYILSKSKENIEQFLRILISLINPILRDDFLRLKNNLETILRIRMPSPDEMINGMIAQLETTIPIVALRMSESIVYKTILNAANAFPGYSIFSTVVETSSIALVNLIIKIAKEIGLGIGLVLNSFINIIQKLNIQRGGKIRRHSIHTQKILHRLKNTLYNFHNTTKRRH
jgi:hypothetical protein